MANLILLCPRHHTLVHDQGFRLALRADRTLTVATGDGVRIVHHPALPHSPAGDLDPERCVTSGTLPPNVTGQRLDLRYAVGVLMQQAA